MKRILVTGGTVFVSRYIAGYLAQKGYEVYVLNRGTRKQPDNVRLICADRNELGDKLRKYSFDAVIDVCAYNRTDINNLLCALGEFGDYIFVSSSAVYPETNTQPFSEEQPTDVNSIWGKYGTDKIEAEKYLFAKVPQAYVLRPAYLYGPMQNIYRESFVFECALKRRKFYIPGDGQMKLQFFHIEDLSRMIIAILEKHPGEHIFNAGNKELTDINRFVEICYDIVGTPLEKVYVRNHENQRDYFCFHNYQYAVDISRKNKLMPEQKNLYEGMKESFEWYQEHSEEVLKKEYIQFITEHFEKIV